MPILPRNVNPLPVSSSNGLENIEVLKQELRELKGTAFPGANVYREYGPTSKAPKEMTRRELEERLDRYLDNQAKLLLAQENGSTRSRLEDVLGSVAMERMLPLWLPHNALVSYSLRVESRNRDEMREDYKNNGSWGFNKKQTPIAVLPASEWASAWKDFVFVDEKVDSMDMGPYMADVRDYLIATVHKFEVVEEFRTGNIRINGKNYRPLDDAVHWRIKSGVEKLWKMVALLSGIEEKPGKTREELVDEAGARVICSPEYFGRRFVRLHQGLQSGSLPDLERTVILQKLPRSRMEESHRSMFLNLLPKFKKFYDNILAEEDRPIPVSDNVTYPFYIEALMRLGPVRGRVFDSNVINLLVYAKDSYEDMYEHQGFDQLGYKARNDGWRVDHYTLFDWLLASRLVPVLLSSQSQEYANRLIETRMQQAKLVR